MEQIAIFCDIDDFCKDYEEYCTHSLLMDKNEVVPKTKMALSESLKIKHYSKIEKTRYCFWLLKPQSTA